MHSHPGAAWVHAGCQEPEGSVLLGISWGATEGHTWGRADTQNMPGAEREQGCCSVLGGRGHLGDMSTARERTSWCPRGYARKHMSHARAVVFPAWGGMGRHGGKLFPVPLTDQGTWASIVPRPDGRLLPCAFAWCASGWKAGACDGGRREQTLHGAAPWARRPPRPP